MAHRRKSAILAIFLYSKHTKSCQGTLGTQELPPTGSMTSHGPSFGPTGSFKRTLGFLRFCKAVFTFSKEIGLNFHNDVKTSLVKEQITADLITIFGVHTDCYRTNENSARSLLAFEYSFFSLHYQI